jgi:hypothetical protein
MLGQMPFGSTFPILTRTPFFGPTTFLPVQAEGAPERRLVDSLDRDHLVP